MARVAESRGLCQSGGLVQGAGIPTESLLHALHRPTRGAVTTPRVGQRHREGKTVTLGPPAKQWWRRWPLLCTPESLFTFLFQHLRSQQQLGQGQGEEMEDPLCPGWILPCPPTEGGASAEVFVTQSCGDEIPGTSAKRMACSLGSCRWRTPRREDGDAASGGQVSVHRGLPWQMPEEVYPTAGSTAWPHLHRPTLLLPGVSRPESAEGLGWRCSWQLEVSHMGRKVKRTRAPHRRGQPRTTHNLLS